MSEPSAELQKALYAALTAHAAVTALIGNRVYDRIPAGATKPYVRIGDDQVLDAGAECLDGSVEVVSTIHVWSAAVGRMEAKAVCGAIRAALDRQDLALGGGFALTEIAFDGARYLDDPDGLSTHGVITFRAFIDAP